jgi:single-strand DNA-binding protein
MTSLNKVILVGNLGRDPEVRTAGDTLVCTLHMATDESYTSRNGEKIERTEWHTVQVWGKPAEVCEKYLQKGNTVLVEGRIQTRKWTDKNGQDRYSTEIRAERIQFLSPKQGNKDTQAPAQTSGSEMDEVPF